MDGVPDDPIRRGRARRQAGALAAAALAVAGIVGAVQIFGNGDGDARPGPVEQPSTALTADADATATDGPSQEELGAVVDAKNASMYSMAVTPGDPEAMAVLWQWEDQRWVLAWTFDGFATRSVRAVPSGSSVTPAAADTFVLREGWHGSALRIISVDGVSDPVDVAAEPGPVAAGEVPVVLAPEAGGAALVAVGAEGTAHPVEVPDGLDTIESYGSRLTAFDFTDDRVAYYWSDDGGAIWLDATPGPGAFLPMVVAAASGEGHAIIEGGDGATLFPFVAVRRADAVGQWTRSAADDSGGRFTLGGAWHEDGEIRVLASRWDEEDRLVDAGVWRVVGGGLEKVASDHPEISDQPDVAALGLEYVDGPVIWVPGPKRGEIWRTTDGGSTWQRFAAR